MPLRWPRELGDRTPPGERKSGAQFRASYNQTRTELSDEFDRLGADHYSIDTHTGSDRDPGVVVRWTMDGTDHAVACDAYSSKKANLRACYRWVMETRRAGDRPVVHGGSRFAAAALPPGTGEESGVARNEDPHEVLGVAHGADPDVVKAAKRRLAAKHHPDSGEDPDEERFKAVNRAAEAVLDG